MKAQSCTKRIGLKFLNVLQTAVSTSGKSVEEFLREAVEIRELLKQNSEETQGVLRALSGEYILPEAGGDLLRDGPGVLPTGKTARSYFSRTFQNRLRLWQPV